MVVGRLILLRFRPWSLWSLLAWATRRARPPAQPSDKPEHSVRLARFEPATPALRVRSWWVRDPLTCGSARHERRDCGRFASSTDHSLTTRASNKLLRASPTPSWLSEAASRRAARRASRAMPHRMLVRVVLIAACHPAPEPMSTPPTPGAGMWKTSTRSCR